MAGVGVTRAGCPLLRFGAPPSMNPLLLLRFGDLPAMNPPPSRYVIFYGTHLFQYRNAGRSFYAMFTSMLGSFLFRFRRDEGTLETLRLSQPFFSDLATLFFVFFGVFVCFNILIALIGDS